MTMTAIAASAGVSIGVSITGKSKCSRTPETREWISTPPKTVPRMIEATVRPSIQPLATTRDRKSTRLNSSHGYISYAVFCLKKKKKQDEEEDIQRRHYGRKTNPIEE